MIQSIAGRARIVNDGGATPAGGTEINTVKEIL
jgi:hypothetical protein